MTFYFLSDLSVFSRHFAVVRRPYLYKGRGEGWVSVFSAVSILVVHRDVGGFFSATGSDIKISHNSLHSACQPCYLMCAVINYVNNNYVLIIYRRLHPCTQKIFFSYYSQFLYAYQIQMLCIVSLSGYVLIVCNNK